MTDRERIKRAVDDALTLMDMAYAGRAWSRNRRPRGWSEARWNRAYSVLKLSEAVSDNGRLTHNSKHLAIQTIDWYEHNLRSMMRDKNFVPPI